MALKQVHLPDGTRSVQSPWVWRGLLLFSIVAGGICLSLATAGKPLLAGAWAFIAVGWFSVSMWVWRRHAKYNDEVWAASSASQEVGAPSRTVGKSSRAVSKSSRTVRKSSRTVGSSYRSNKKVG